MIEIEITTRVNNSLGDALSILKSKGFIVKEQYRLEDIYMTQDIDLLNKDNILDILAKSVLLRNVIVKGKENKYITYKKKSYENDIVISEEKISVSCEDLIASKALFEAMNFKELVEIKQDLIVLKNGDLEFAFQDVEGLGLVLEYEHLNDFEGYSNEEIIEVKKQMLNEIRSYGLDVTNDYDVKKAFELISNKFWGML